MWSSVPARRRVAASVIAIVAVAAIVAVGARWRRGPRGIDATPIAIEPAADVPAWARASDSPRRIAGEVRLDGHGVAATVHLRLDVPDARVWRGRTVETDADGRFDFGVHPAGLYLVVALGALGSRVVELDTRRDDRARVAVTVRPCQRRYGGAIDQRSGRPLVGAAVEVAGLQVATTDRSGRYTWCAPPDLDEVDVRARGFVAFAPRMSFESRLLLLPPRAASWPMIPAGPRRRLQIVDAAGGTPVAGLVARPTYETGFTHSLPLLSPVHAVTDADGWIDVDWVPLEDDQFRSVGVWVVEIDRVGPWPSGRGDLDPAVPDRLLLERTGGPRVQIRGQVRRGGQPLVDTPIEWVDRSNYEPNSVRTRTDLDGRFTLAQQLWRPADLHVADRWFSVPLHDAASVDVDFPAVESFVVTVDDATRCLAWADGTMRFFSEQQRSARTDRAGWVRDCSGHTRGRVPMRFLSPPAGVAIADCAARPTIAIRPPPAADAAPAPAFPIDPIDPVDLGLDVTFEDDGGHVTAVGGAAEAAGLQVGDRITAVGDVSWVGHADAPYMAERAFPACTDVIFTLVRDGAPLALIVPATY